LSNFKAIGSITKKKKIEFELELELKRNTDKSRKNRKERTSRNITKDLGTLK